MGKYTNIDDPSAYFQTLLWTGNSTDSRALTNDGNSDLQPDWVWLKNRDLGYNHFLQDSSRGNTKVLLSDSTSAEGTYTNMVESFDTNGFTVGFDGSQVPNFNGNTFVGWQWKANGGTTASNSDGSITSTVQANQDAGFSIITYTGNSNNPSSVGHGLGVVPNFYIIKQRDAANAWKVYHAGVATDPEDYVMELNSTGARENNAIWNDTGPTSSVINFTDHGAVNQSGETYVAYCFAEKQGYSKFGSYVGNGSINGTFVYTGFKPAFVIIRSSSIAGQWLMFDNKRTIANGDMDYLLANGTGAESDAGLGNSAPIDFLSNGFKLRNSDAWANGGNTYIYMAFAESPFVTSTGIMGTAQ